MDDQNCCLSLQVSQDATVVEQNGNTEELDLQDYEFRKHPWGSVFEGTCVHKFNVNSKSEIGAKIIVSLALRKSSFMLIITILVECPQASCSQCNITFHLVLLAGFA